MEQIVALLAAERDKLNRAIEVLKGPIRRRGRPPKNPLAFPATPARTKPKARTAAQRKAQSERMKIYWANRKNRTKK
jgi:hypothetical protein